MSKTVVLLLLLLTLIVTRNPVFAVFMYLLGLFLVFDFARKSYFFKSFLPVKKGRRGSCKRCGKCCIFFMMRCPFLKKNNTCMIYPIRPLICRKFPMDEGDLRAFKECGYYW